MSLDLYLTDTSGVVLWAANITHNLKPMAAAVGLDFLWDPLANRPNFAHHAVPRRTAQELIPSLWIGLKSLLSADDSIRLGLGASNGWGTAEDLERFVCAVLAACFRYPEARVGVST